MNPFIEFVRERESIRKKREAGFMAPWSNKLIYQKYRFTNVRRKQDRVSRWLINNVLLEKYMDPCPSFLKFTAFCRWVNWPPTIKALMDVGYWPHKNPDFKAIGKFIDKRMKAGDKVWTGAYMIRAKPGSNKGKGHFVAVEVVDKPLTKVMPVLEATLNDNMRSRRAVWEVLYSCNNWGPFLSGQVVDDWSWTSLLAGAVDTYTWAPQGPGSLRGFNRLKGLPLKTKHCEEEWCTQLQTWRQEIIRELGVEFESMTLMDVQNVCCEVDKVLRVSNGEGRPRAMYKPHEYPL